MGTNSGGAEPPPPKECRFVTTDVSRTAAQVELEQVLQSPEFRQSEQSKRLLRYLVEHSLNGNPDLLRERAIGVAIFGLESGYDTNENPIVRVRANEIRKRLTKHYANGAPHGRIRLEVPAGAYRVEFRTVREVPPGAIPPNRRTPGLMLAALAILLLVAAAGILGFWMHDRVDAVSDFWHPALENRAPVVICSGNPVVYQFTREFHERVRQSVPDHYHLLTEALNLRPDQAIRASDIVAIPNQYIGLGSAQTVARLSIWLGRQHKEVDIRFGNDLTFSELRKAPSVLIGAFQNRWTVEFGNELRFVFETSGRVPAIRDTRTGKIWSLPQLKDNGETTEDYVLISRLLRAKSGAFVVIAAGITQYGSYAVGEILTNPALLGEATKTAKSGWANHNLQLLYHVQVIGQTPGPPELIALHQW